MVNCSESKVYCSVSERLIQGVQKQNRIYKRVFAQANILYPYYANLKNYRIPRLSESEGCPTFREYKMESIVSRNDVLPQLKYTSNWHSQRDSSLRSNNENGMVSGHHESGNGSPSGEQPGSDTDDRDGPLQLTSSSATPNFQNGFLKPQVPWMKMGNRLYNPLFNGSQQSSNGVSCESNAARHNHAIGRPSSDSTHLVNGFRNSTDEVGFSDDEEDLANEADDNDLNDQDILVIGLSGREKRELCKWSKYSSRR